MSCPICCDNFTDVARKEIKCNYCNYSTCVKCVKQFLLTINQDPNCMNCHVAWNREFVDGVCSKTFMVNDYKKHREDLLLDREKSLLPDTVPYVEREVRKRESQKFVETLRERSAALKKEISKINEQIYRLYSGQYVVVDGEVVPANQQGAGSSSSQPKEERRVFVRNCVVDGCRGFLSSQWKCGVCSTWVCPDCHEVKRCQKDENHTCNPDNVASAQLISKSTKPCPKCAAPILKVSGCDQMWCTLCQTAFSWKTGNAVTSGPIHNPHYFEWARSNGVAIPRFDNPHQGCNDGHQMIGYNKIFTFTKKYAGADPRIPNLDRLYRIIIHLYDVEMRQFNHHVQDTQSCNRDLRVQYLLKEVDEEDWKKTLQKREKRREFEAARHLVLEMFYRVGTDLMRRTIEQTPTLGVFDNKMETLRNCLTEIEGLIEYFNSSLKRVYDRFNSKSRKLFVNNKTWNFELP